MTRYNPTLQDIHVLTRSISNMKLQRLKRLRTLSLMLSTSSSIICVNNFMRQYVESSLTMSRTSMSDVFSHCHILTTLSCAASSPEDPSRNCNALKPPVAASQGAATRDGVVESSAHLGHNPHASGSVHSVSRLLVRLLLSIDRRETSEAAMETARHPLQYTLAYVLRLNVPCYIYKYVLELSPLFNGTLNARRQIELPRITIVVR
jgi:hypothetical protein